MERSVKLLEEFRLVIVDECHHAAAKTSVQILKHCKNADRRIGLSGTPLRRADGKNLLVQAVIGPPIFKVTNKQLIETGISAEPVVFFHRSTKPHVGDHLPYLTVYQQGISLNFYRNELIKQIAVSYEAPKKVLIVIRNIDHGAMLEQMLRTSGRRVLYLHGELPMEERMQGQTKFNSGECDILIASQILGEGMNFGVSIDALIYGIAEKGAIKVLQNLGRSLRQGGRQVHVHDFFDTNNQFLLRHSETRRRVYKQQQFKLYFIGENAWDPSTLPNEEKLQPSRSSQMQLL